MLCRTFNKSCISSAYEIPTDAIQLVAFSRRDKDKMTSLFNGAVNSSASYYIIVHYRQTQGLSKKVEQISITDYEKLNIFVTFHYCPANPGCRIVIGEEDNLSFRFSKGTFTATIQHERRTHLSYILLVPKTSYTTGLLELQSNDRVNQFLKNCGKNHFFIDPVSGRQCREDVFSLTVRFNGEPLKCRCNVLGSRATVCDEFGGQCLCRPNVVGRRCDRCKLGHSGYPRCRRCGCHEVGSVSQSCFSNGRCRCKPGFGGYKCDRCASSSYYGFPDCKLCNCNNLGSLSTFCRSRDGQCQCRRNFQGKKCNECRIGFYDFPTCKACNCNPAGIKLLPGETNGCGSVNNTHCRCKDNVIGDDCDSCKAFHFNLQINNPLGCQSCDCNTNGTLGTIKTCRETNGQCLCKSHVTGRQCERCKEGYYSLKGSNVFGCKRCSCNVGGSVSPSCNAITGECSCLPGVGGGQCDSVTSGDYYYPTLHQYKIELEDALATDNDESAYFRYDDSEFPGFSWRGYVVFSQAQTSIYIMIDIPRTSKYQLIFHYLLARYAPVTALVKFIPTLDSASFPSGPATEQTLDVRFRTTATWIFAIAQFLVVRDNWGDTQQVLLSQRKWKLTIDVPASDLLLDYMVLLPEEYYRPQNLEVQVSSPCELRGDQKHCAHFAYPSLKQDGFVTIQAEDISVVGGIRRNRRVTDIPFQGLILSGSRNVMSVRLPSKVQGQFVLLASYFHNADDGGILNVVVRTGAETYRAKMSILSCRYRFGCRQVAIDEKHQIRAFTADQNEVTTVSITTTLTIALDFITAIPLSKWKQQYLVPAEQCISNGLSCIQSAYPTPTDAVKIEAEDRFKGGDRAPYYIMDHRASLKHLKVGEKTVHFSGTAATGRYYVIVHFYQPNFLSFLGKVVISGQNAASTLLRFRYCPHVSGCRAIGTSQYREGMSESIYIGRQNNILVSIAIPEDKGVWIDYVLLVPISSFSPSLLEVNPIDVTQDFIQDCGHEFHSSEFPSSEFPRSEFPSSEFASSEFPRSEFLRSEFPRSEIHSSEFPSSEFPRSEFHSSEFPSSEFLRSEFPRSEFHSSEFPSSEFPRSEFHSSEFPRSEFLRSEFPRSEFHRSEFLRSEFPRSEFHSSEFPSSEFPRSEFHSSEFPSSEFPRSEFPCSEFPSSEFHSSEFPSSEFPRSEFHSSEFPSSEFPRSEFPRSEFPRSEFDRSEFHSSEFPSSEFPRSEFHSSEFPRSEFHSSEFPRSEFLRSEFPRSELPRSEFPSSELPRSEFHRSEFHSSEFPRSEFPRSEFHRSEFLRSEFPRSEFDRSEFHSSEFPSSEFPRSEFHRSEFLRSEFPSSEFPRSEFPRSEFPRSEFDRSEFHSSEFPSSEFPRSEFHSSEFPRSEFHSSEFPRSEFLRRSSLEVSYLEVSSLVVSYLEVSSIEVSSIVVSSLEVSS
ncbi:hypothetical protein ACROYT_G008904 [Oculina patagonica]